MNARGLVYVATASDGDVEEAFVSAESVKRHAPDLSATLWTDRPGHPLCGLGCFDTVTAIPETEPRAACLARTTYARTLAPDLRMRALTPAVAALFSALDACDVVMAPEMEQAGAAGTDVLLYRSTGDVLAWLRSSAGQGSLAPLPATVRAARLDPRWSAAEGTAETGMARAAGTPAARTAELLGIARRWTQTGRDGDAQRVYDYVGTLRPAHQMRAYWPLALVRDGAVGEEWATPALKRADLHLLYGQRQQAADLLADAAAPETRAQALTGRARLALHQGAANDAVALARQALGLAPRSTYVLAILGAALSAAGRTEEAVAPLTAASAERPGAYFLLGLAWQKLGQPQRAADAYRKGYAFDPTDFGPANNLLPALMESCDYGAALAHADHLLAARPGHTTSLAFKHIALGELGRAPDLAALTDYGALLKAERPALPAGYADRDAFHRALAAEIAAEPTLKYERNTTRFGHQTDDIAFAATPAIQALNTVLMDAAARRARAARAASSHPFDHAAPRDFRLYSWGVIIGEKGHQAPHFHPHGWLSGVYYIAVPEEIAQDDPARNGWIEFGRGDARWNRDTTPMPVRQLRPEAGVLLTFPSYFWHCTRPLRPNKPRISFAFDVIPL